jgi:signal transduction histidine kinase
VEQGTDNKGTHPNVVLDRGKLAFEMPWQRDIDHREIPLPRPVRVLLVEDSADDVALILRALKQGMEVLHEVVGSRDALLAALDRDDWHVVLADYALPHFSAPEALKVVRARDADLPFILVSGTVGEEVAVEAMRAGVTDYVMKSNLHRLVPVIDREVRAAAARRSQTREREQLEAQLIQAQKLEAVGTLAGGVAHDFNNLLVVIRGNVELLARDSAADNVQPWINEVLEAATRAEELVKQLLVFSRRQPLEKRAIQINDVVSGIVGMLSRLLGESIAIQTQTASDLPTTTANASQLEQVIVNLATNARDAMPDGGEITIRTGLRELTEATPGSVSDARPGRYITLSVTDTGQGIEPDLLTSIFDPFFTTKPPGKGTGLGLSTVHGIAKQHGGWATVDSVVGRGTTFTLLLPVNEEECQAIATTGFDGREHTAPSCRVLVVEDDPSVRLLTTKILSHQGHVVTSAESCAQARRAVVKESAAFDVIVCDVGLPDGSGLNLATSLLRQYPTMRALIASGYTESLFPGDLDTSRARYLPKPFGVRDLVNGLARLLEAGSQSPADTSR